MYLLKTTDHFEKWLKKLKDKPGKARILASLKLLEQGHIGDWKTVGGKVSELRVHYGAGYIESTLPGKRISSSYYSMVVISPASPGH